MSLTVKYLAVAIAFACPLLLQACAQPTVLSPDGGGCQQSSDNAIGVVNGRIESLRSAMQEVNSKQVEVLQALKDLRSPVNCSVSILAYSGYDYNGSCNVANQGYVELNGRRVWNGGWCSSYPNLRGVNTMVVDPFSCTHHDVRNFDTHALADQTQDLIAYLQYVREGTVLVGVTGDEPTLSLEAALRQLRTMGVPVNDVQYRGNFAFFVQKGYPENTAMAKSLTNTVAPSSVRVVLKGSTVERLTVTPF